MGEQGVIVGRFETSHEIALHIFEQRYPACGFRTVDEVLTTIADVADDPDVVGLFPSPRSRNRLAGHFIGISETACNRLVVVIALPGANRTEWMTATAYPAGNTDSNRYASINS